MLAIGQTVQEQVGYTALLAELGGAPGGGADLSCINKEDTAWRYRKGTSEASVPTDEWRTTAFVEDGTWITGQTSIGYADGDDKTILSDMRNVYRSVFLRHPFTLDAGKIPHQLVLRIYVDDGAIIWINGTEVARVNMSSGAHAYNSLAATSVQEASWMEITIKGAQSYLLPGTNMLAVHAFNGSQNSSDFSIDCELFMPPVTQVESPDDRAFTLGDPVINKYLPITWTSPAARPDGDYQFTQTGGDYDGTTVEVDTYPWAYSFGQSPHANNVAFRYYHNTNSVAPDIDRVRSFESNAWLGSGFLNNGSSSRPADFEYAVVQNHSWIGADSAANRTSYNRALRRYDYAIAQDDFLALVGLNNGTETAVPPLLATSYHSVAVGLTNGLHSRGGTVSFYDGPGRTKPEIVAPDYATSYSTAQVSSASALLYEVANFDPLLKEALHVEAVKAILLAGATKEEFPGWSRTPSAPLDAVFGAGELNVQHSYHILKGGKQEKGTSAAVKFNGWDFTTITGGGTNSYLFNVVPNTKLTQLSTLLTWHRQFAEATPWSNNFATQPTLPNLNLRLYQSTNGVPGALVDSSVSSVDNLEHIYRLELPAGEYLLQVDSDTAVEYGIAWRSQPLVEMPGFSLVLNGDDVEIKLSELADGVTYIVERSPNLVAWTSVGSVLAPANLVVDVDAALQIRYFYRIAYEITP